jgi:hypothetical protein
MAKLSKQITFKNATIDIKDMTITEYEKDSSTTYNIINILDEWNGIDGISLTLKQEDRLESTVDKNSDIEENPNGEDE